MQTLATITIQDNKNRTKLSVLSNDRGQKLIERGEYDVLIDSQTVIKDYSFSSGAVYTINVFENNGTFVSIQMDTEIR